MTFQTEQEIFDLIKKNKTVPINIIKAREQHKELNALYNGKAFIDELVSKIESIESEAKINIRKKYSRDIKDFFERLLLPVDNVFSSNGVIKKYDVKNADTLKKVLSAISDLKDGKSIERYVETTWMPLYHYDPNGLIMMEYVNGAAKPYPTYKSINKIRNYLPKGQTLEWLLFEPTKTKEGNQVWRFVDDKKDYSILQQGETYSIIEDKTFEHPFGSVPALIVSDIIDMQAEIRLSAIDKIVPTAKEYARDLSIKTIYKFLHGFPIHWRYVSICQGCSGTKKKGEGKCTDCDGYGYYRSKDVTDLVTLPLPQKEDAKIAPDISGYISPDLNTWKQFNEELEYLEQKSFETHWGTKAEKQNNETATGRFIDVQPVVNRLNKYANVAEWVEWKLTEWTINYIDATKNKNQSVSLIVYGRRYIIDSPDTLLNNYLKAKKEGANTTVLDRLMEEYLSAKFRNDPEWLRSELIKVKLEPFVHASIDEAKATFGIDAANKKIFFAEWFNSSLINEDISKLKEKFEADWKLKLEESKQGIDIAQQTKVQSQASLRGSVGGVQGMVQMLTAVSQGQMSEDAAKQVIVEMYGISEEVALSMVKKPTPIGAAGA